MNNKKNNIKYTFISNNPSGDLKSLLEGYFKRTFQSNNKGVQYSGLFIGETSFEIRSKWQLAFGRKPYKSQAPIQGHFSPIDSATTKVQLTVRHKIFRAYMVLPLLLPLYLIASGLFNSSVDIVIAGVIILMFFAGFYFLAFSTSYNNVISELTLELKLKEMPHAK